MLLLDCFLTSAPLASQPRALSKEWAFLPVCMHRDGGYREITDAFNPMREVLGDFHLHSKVGGRAALLGRPSLISITLVGFPGPYQQEYAKKSIFFYVVGREELSSHGD